MNVQEGRRFGRPSFCSGELEVEGKAGGEFDEVALVVAGLDGDVAVGVIGRGNMAVGGHAPAEEGDAEAEVYGGLAAPVEAVADHGREVDAAVVGEVGSEPNGKVGGEASPAGVEARFGENGDDEAWLTVVVVVFFPVEIDLEAGSAADVEPAVELIAVGCGESCKDARRSGIAADEAEVEVEIVAPVDEAAVAAFGLARERRGCAEAEKYDDNETFHVTNLGKSKQTGNNGSRFNYF